ncbi:MAG: hypothetical protein B6240_05260 [Desulfobacteraceae bacterium 4572_87]|nr:MAG: hypothetical protein B6240_05260 [Desulfobacteraceae bacterium 4572_87]
MRGNIICLLSLYSCIPLVLYLFSKYKPEQAVIVAFFGALMFLPMEKLQVPLILYNKMTATAMGVMIAIKMYDPEKLENGSIHPIDIPMILWISSGFLASVTNGLGPKDGLQESFTTFTQWGIPYIAGRIYFSNAEGMKLLCRSIFTATLLYIPFVLFELKMSPQSHAIVYGYMQHSFAQVMRGDGYRPMVFMEHGIMLGTWMAMGALVGLWCTYTKAFPKKMWKKPTILLAIILLIAAVACKSSGATGLCIMGLLALLVTAKLKFAILVWILLAIPPAYVGTRATGYWDGQNLCDLITEKFSEDRAASLQFRFDNENILVEKALERPLFGWGGWGRSRVYDDETGEDVSVTDGFWIIVLGTRGYFGLFSVTLIMILPMLLFLLKCPAKLWGKPEFAPTAVLCIIPLLFMIDCMLNAMVNQAYIIFAGGTSGMLAKYGITRLEGQTASHKESATDSQPELQPQATAPAMQFRKSREGSNSAELGIRPLLHTELSGNTGAYAFRSGISEIGNADPQPRFFRRGKNLKISFFGGKKEGLSPEAEVKKPAYRGPRNLLDSKNVKTEHISRRLRVDKEPEPPETSDGHTAEEQQDEGYAYTKEKWIKHR